MKLYYTKGACSLATRIIVNEVGLPCEYESVDLASKKTETGQDFYTINPKGAVPTLITNNDETLTENAVIMQYLADTSQAIQLLPPANHIEHYRVIEWLNFIATDLHKGFGPLFSPSLPPEVRDKIYIPLLKSKLSYVNNHLEHHHYLNGKDFTLPDAYLFVMLTWALYFKFTFATWPHLSRYFTELQKRTSVQQSLKEESLHITMA